MSVRPSLQERGFQRKSLHSGGFGQRTCYSGLENLSSGICAEAERTVRPGRKEDSRMQANDLDSVGRWWLEFGCWYVSLAATDGATPW